jgi:hypothetical protein
VCSDSTCDGLLYRLTAGCYVTIGKVGISDERIWKESNRIRTVDSSLRDVSASCASAI